jgi:hypothetical protein
MQGTEADSPSFGQTEAFTLTVRISKLYFSIFKGYSAGHGSRTV